MKCDELKVYNVVATADVNPEVVDSLGCTEWAGYDKDEVEAAITELKEVYKDSVDVKVKIWERCKKAEDELRKTHRALWLARAELCHRLDVDKYLRKHCNSWYNENCLTWQEACVAMEVKMCKAESKCLAKAEEYK